MTSTPLGISESERESYAGVFGTPLLLLMNTSSKVVTQKAPMAHAPNGSPERGRDGTGDRALRRTGYAQADVAACLRRPDSVGTANSLSASLVR